VKDLSPDPHGQCQNLACMGNGSCYSGCADTVECVKGYYCNNSACYEQGATGATCDPSLMGIDCLSFVCKNGLCT